MTIFSKSKKHKQKFIACTSKSTKYEFINPKDLQIKVGKKSVQIEIISDKQGFEFVVLNKKKYQVDVVEKNQNQYEILVNGVSYSISVESPFSFKRRKYLAKSKVESKIEKIHAPMPGKIIEYLVEENQQVKAGEPLLILEAMKMQNEILSNFEGKIKSINFHANDNVMKDDILIEIEK